MKTKKYYKIVDNELKSCSIGKQSELEVQYIKDSFVKSPKKGMGLFIFDNSQSAYDFLSGKDGRYPGKWWSNFQIWECEVLKPRKVIWISNLLDKEYLLTFLKLKKHKKSCHFKTQVPKGTLVCDAVKLTKKVY